MNTDSILSGSYLFILIPISRMKKHKGHTWADMGSCTAGINMYPRHGMRTPIVSIQKSLKVQQDT